MGLAMNYDVELREGLNVVAMCTALGGLSAMEMVKYAAWERM